MELGLKLKKANEVWVRWFYISDWSSLKAIPLENLVEHIKEICSYYAPEFRSKATFEIIDGNQVKYLKASEV